MEQQNPRASSSKPPKITNRQQNKLISLMRSYSAPGPPRFGPTIEYADNFWTYAAQALNEIEPDPRHRRDKDKWRQVWRYYKARVKKKIDKNIPRTIFEEQIVNILQKSFLEESNIHIDDEDSDSVEYIEIQPDVVDMEEEPAATTNRPGKIGQRRKTVGFVEQTNNQIYHAEPITSAQPTPSTRRYNANTSTPQNQARGSFDAASGHSSTSNQQFNQLRTEIKTEPNSSARPSAGQQSASSMQTEIKTEPVTSMDEPSISTPIVKTEPGTTQTHPTPSTSTHNMSTNLAPNSRKRPNEENIAYEDMRRQLIELIEAGNRMAEQLNSHNQAVISIAETFRRLRPRQTETPENNNSTDSQLPTANVVNGHQTGTEENIRSSCPSTSANEVPRIRVRVPRTSETVEETDVVDLTL